MGSDPASKRRTGVWCYKRERTSTKSNIFTYYMIAIDLVEGKWVKHHLSLDSAGRIAVGDMRGLGVVVSPKPLIPSRRLNDCARTMPRSRTQFRDTLSLPTRLSISTKTPLLILLTRRCTQHMQKLLSRSRSSTMRFSSVSRTLPPSHIPMRSNSWTSPPASSLLSSYHRIRRSRSNTAKASR